MDDLFSASTRERSFKNAPLAVRMRPDSLDEYVGQQKAVGAVNAPPVCGDHGIPQLLALCTVGIEAVGAHLQEKEPHGQPQADGTEQHRHGPCPAAESPLGQGAEKFGHDVTPFNGLTLSVIADAMPPLPKGEALAFDTKFMILSKAPPLGELAQSA